MFMIIWQYLKIGFSVVTSLFMLFRASIVKRFEVPNLTMLKFILMVVEVMRHWCCWAHMGLDYYALGFEVNKKLNPII
jgi:hypothetical protein